MTDINTTVFSISCCHLCSIVPSDALAAAVSFVLVTAVLQVVTVQMYPVWVPGLRIDPFHQVMLEMAKRVHHPSTSAASSY